MRQYGQAATGLVFGLTLATLIVFWTVKDTKPSGSAVLPILYGVLGASALIWLIAEALRRGDLRRQDREPVRKRAWPPIEQWLRGRIDAHAVIEHERSVRTAREYMERLGDWDTRNVNDLAGLDPGSFTFDRSAAVAQDLVVGYRADPRDPERVDGIEPPHGIEQQQAYGERRLEWLKARLRELDSKSLGARG
ncbi:MAG: hypothetical protein ACHQHO_04985 [Solirubrobacterales bacterium]